MLYEELLRALHAAVELLLRHAGEGANGLAGQLRELADPGTVLG
jgi:hypothetical protein